VTELAGGTPKFIPLSAENGFKLTPDDLKKHIDSTVKAIFLIIRVIRRGFLIPVKN